MQVSDSNHILVADGQEPLRAQVVEALRAEGHTISQAGDGATARAQLDDNVFQLVVAQLELPGWSGMDLIAYVQEHSPGTPIVVISAQGSVDAAVEAMRAGAFDFLETPLNIQHLCLTVDRALEKASLHNAFFYLRHEQPYLYNLEQITAESPPMKRLLDQISRLAPSNMTVLLTGETGTGKSLVAGAIHANSPRRENTLVTVNCAALTETLLESELFGHEKGAFTGAHKARAGRFQQAHGGTLFLDEIGEMSPGIQAKVLRAIEDQVIYRLGGSREIHVNVRILAATNRDLEAEVERGNFRRDLFYRLNVAPLHLPPLRERHEDILPLARRFMARICADMGRPDLAFDQEAQGLLTGYDWPGNIREMRNVIERTALFTDSNVVKGADLDLPTGIQPRQEGEAPREDMGGGYFVAQTLDLEALERQAIETALEMSDWVQKEAASLLGISERRMTYRLNKLGITSPAFRTRRRRGGNQK